MGYKVLANRDQIHYGVKSLIADTIKDMKNLPKMSAGSTVYCIETQKKYMMNTKGYWQEAANIGSSTDFTNGDYVVDGTELSDSTTYIQDGNSTAGPSDAASQYIWEGGSPTN